MSWVRRPSHGAERSRGAGAERGEVPLGVVLADVDGEVGDAPGVLLVGGERRGAEGVAHADRARPRRRPRRRAYAGASTAPAVPSASPASTRRPRAEGGARARSPASSWPTCMSATWSGSAPSGATSRARQAAAAAEPHGRDTDAAPGEAGPGEVPAVLAHRRAATASSGGGARDATRPRDTHAPGGPAPVGRARGPTTKALRRGVRRGR